MQIIDSSRGPSGLAELSVTTEKVRVTYLEGDLQGKVYEVVRSDAPKSIKDGPAIVRMNSALTQIFSVAPPKGDYSAKFVGFVARQGELPSPKAVEARTVTSQGKSYSFPAGLEFTAIYEVQSKKFVGYEALQTHIPYVFHPTGDGKTVVMGRGAKKVDIFFKTNGVDLGEVDLDFTENLLPKLQEYLLAADKTIRISVNENGFVANVGELPEM